MFFLLLESFYSDNYQLSLLYLWLQRQSNYFANNLKFRKKWNLQTGAKMSLLTNYKDCFGRLYKRKIN